MNLLLQSLASEEWNYVVKALLHTLWLGALAAGILCLVLRGTTNPVVRYRWCIGALLAIALGGVIAWAMLQEQSVLAESFAAKISAAAPSPFAEGVAPAATLSSSMVQAHTSSTPTWVGIPWLALAWLVGTGAMLIRAGTLVVAAEKLRRRSTPLQAEAVVNLIEDVRQKLGLARRIKALVTEQLISPAVMGVAAPVLILPLSMVTSMPIAQLQLVLLHELAHIRRGDYLVNLGQLLVESLLFFNPAVWWISRQIRQEREACCDAMAIRLAGEPLQYARTLAQVAGDVLAAAPAFGDRRNPSGLKDRIQRLLVPGYRPALRLTWRALLVTLFVGGGLLFISALGMKVTVAAMLSPQQRIDRIVKKMVEYGENPGALEYANSQDAPKTSVSGQVVMEAGSPVPKRTFLIVRSSANSSSTVKATEADYGAFADPSQRAPSTSGRNSPTLLLPWRVRLMA